MPNAVTPNAVTPFDVVVLVPVAVGLALVLLGMRLAATRARHRREWVETTGMVTGWNHSNVGRDSSLSRPVVTFTTREGAERTAVAASAVDWGVYLKGRRPVRVWYDPSDPSVIDADVLGWRFIPGCLVTLGLMVLAVFAWVAAKVLL